MKTDFSKIVDILTASEILNTKEGNIYNYCKKKKFINAVKTSEGWEIPLEDIYKYKKEREFVNSCYTRAEVTRLLNCDARFIPTEIKDDFIEIDSINYIPKEIVDKYMKDNIIEIDKNKYVTTAKASEILEINRERINKYIRRNIFTDCIKHRNYYYIAKEEIYQIRKLFEDYITTKEVSQILNITIPHMSKMCKENAFKDIKRNPFDGAWLLNSKEIEQYVKRNNLSSKQPDRRLSRLISQKATIDSYITKGEE